MEDDMAASLIWILLGAAGMAVELDLDCAAPDRARALIEYARLSEIEQVEDIHRDALDKALSRCPPGAGREACRSERRREALLDWERKLAEIKARYEKMHKDFEERCRASIARATAQTADKGSYSISSSARTSTDGGIVRPRALAVLRLMTNANLVGRSTGRSAGFAPRRILST